MSRAIHFAAGVSFRAYNDEYMACMDCDHLVARPGADLPGEVAAEHVCR